MTPKQQEEKRLYDDILLSAKRFAIFAGLEDGDVIKGTFKIKDDGPNWVLMVGLESNLISTDTVES